jgi:hypothetical protein
MNQLHIRSLKLYNPCWIAIRFTGDTVPFKAMVSLLKQHSLQSAYWHKSMFGGYGGWIVRADILDRYADRFENFESRIAIARGTYERKEIGEHA